MPFALSPELSWLSLSFILLAAAFAYVMFGATGFGSSVIAVPTFAHILPLTFVVPLITAVDCFAAVTANVRQWRQIDWLEFRRVFIPSVFGIALGSTLLVNLPRNAALLALGAFTAAISLYTLYGTRQWKAISTAWAIPAGVIGGVFSALFGTGGPLYMAYFSSRIEDKTALRATSAMMIASSVILRAVLFAFTTLWLQPGMVLMIALLVPCMLVGYFTGSHLHQRLSGPAVRRWIAWLLLANGVLLLLRGAGLIA